MITLIGNCQLHRLKYIFKNINKISDVEYYANTAILDAQINVEHILERCKNSTPVIAQVILEPTNPLNYINLKKNKPQHHIRTLYFSGRFI